VVLADSFPMMLAGAPPRAVHWAVPFHGGPWASPLGSPVACPSGLTLGPAEERGPKSAADQRRLGAFVASALSVLSSSRAGPGRPKSWRKRRGRPQKHPKSLLVLGTLRVPLLGGGGAKPPLRARPGSPNFATHAVGCRRRDAYIAKPAPSGQNKG